VAVDSKVVSDGDSPDLSELSVVLVHGYCLVLILVKLLLDDVLCVIKTLTSHAHLAEPIRHLLLRNLKVDNCLHFGNLLFEHLTLVDGPWEPVNNVILLDTLL
jgi:hypothetical protein